MTDSLTVNEVVAFTDAEEKVVRKEVEYGLFGAESPPRFALPALVYFRVMRSFGLRLRSEDRRKVYAAIEQGLTASGLKPMVKLSPVLELKLDEVTKELQDKIERFDAWKSELVTDQRILGGEPVFPGTRLAVRRIGGLAMKGAEREIREDYPYITSADIAFAVMYTKAYPKLGRPRAAQTSTG